jgi:hyperosmotically inducible protein
MITFRTQPFAVQEGSDMADASDTWITAKVKADLMYEKGIPGSDIKVETSSGVVSLSSTVVLTDAQKEAAVAITKKIQGVRAVSVDGLAV